MPKLIRITTVPLSLKLLLTGQMKFMKDKGWEVLMVSADDKMVYHIERAENVPHTVIPFTRKITPFQDLKCLWQLYQLFKKEQPDIVHTHTPKAGLLGMVAAKLAGVKVRIHTIAGLPYMSATGNKRNLLEYLEKTTYNNATDVWPNSEGLKSIVLENHLCLPERLTIIGSGSSNGVDLVKFNRGVLKENHLIAATMRILPGEDDYIILAVGRLVLDKGIEELVEAFLGSKIVSKAKLVLLGSFEQDLNPLSPEIIKTITDHPRIVQIDWSDHVAHYMALADVLIHPSHREGFPNVLLEAGAMELPVICSDIVGNTDLISQQKTGLIFPVKNIEVMKEAMEFAFVKRDKMTELAANLHKLVIENYQRSDIQEKIYAKYQSLLEASNHAE